MEGEESMNGVNERRGGGVEEGKRGERGREEDKRRNENGVYSKKEKK